MRKRSLAARATSLAGCLMCLLLATPAAAAGVYLVEAGDTLAAISRLFDVEVDRIIEANGLGSDNIAPGDRLRIPDRQPKPPTVAAGATRHSLNAARVLQQAVCREEKVYHSVAKGDTLSAIANRYATEVDNLLQLNGLRKKDRLAIGQKILVRKSGPRSHTVARGETLTRIAQRYGIEVDEIVRVNHLNKARITAGQQLLIETCDPVAVAGNAPPPLGGPDLSGLQTGGLGAAGAESAAVSGRVISIARTMLDVPYRFGGNSLRGIDCSAYVQRVFGLMDVPLPRTAREQYRVGAHVDKIELQVGDLVFFRTYASFPSHVGIYLGDNRFIHASSMVRRVAIDSLDQPYYRKRFIGARRLVGDVAPAVASTP